MCDKEFDVNDKKMLSLLVRSLIIACPYCMGTDIYLTNKGKLLVERRAKINKIENDKT